MNKSRFCFLLALAASGCLPTRQGSDYASVRGVEAKTRMEIIESLEAPENHVVVFLAVTLEHVKPGLRYRTENRLEYTDGEHISTSSSDGWAKDSIWESSSRLSLDIESLQGRTVRARVFVNGTELARDSATYY